MPRHQDMGDLSHSLKRSLPSTQARQRLNWFSIVNLRRVCKENVWLLMVLLQRPQRFLKLFPVQKTRANGSGRRIHFFFLSRPFFSIEWCSAFGSENLDARSFFFLNDFAFCAFVPTGSCITFVSAICLAQKTSILDTTWFGSWQTAGSVSQV